ncbi:peptidoglycan recognition family protein [Kitasatospora sp. NPDC085879]|uniref:peptidoglycan recognition protein family protein n=1 Tax=Kitasatospora sp. NPDC085879 TaxID=3154769 RepID=UPI00341D2323
MKLVSRSEWGAAAPTGSYTRISSTRGVKIHYEGSPVPDALLGDHGRCAGHVRAIQASHMANTSEGWIDIAYSFVVCPHGYVHEGRGLGHRNGANGNPTLNAGHYAVCAMVGTSGITSPTDEMLDGLVDAIDYCRSEGGRRQRSPGPPGRVRHRLPRRRPVRVGSAGRAQARSPPATAPASTRCSRATPSAPSPAASRPA